MEQLATAQQKKNTTLNAARTNVMSVVSTLKAMRSEESFDKIWLNICQSANELQLSQPAMPRQRRPPKRPDDGAAPHEYPSSASCNRIQTNQTWFAFLDICHQQSQGTVFSLFSDRLPSVKTKDFPKTIVPTYAKGC